MWACLRFSAAVVAVGILASCAARSSNVQQMLPDPGYLKDAPARTFDISYNAVIRAPEGTKKLRVWLPVPKDTPVQKILDLSFSREVRIYMEPKYGNKIAYFEMQNPPPRIEIKMRFRVERREVKLDLARLSRDGKDPDGAFPAFLGEKRLVPITDEIRRIADRLTRGKRSTLEKARAIYDYVVSKMTYDKSVPGWGRGDVIRACRVGKGNCTDFHSLFNALCRAQGIPSGFEIGLYLPYDFDERAELGSYHCWAMFRVPGKTWVPVDASEASKLGGEMADYFFGNQTPNRVTLSTGRDLRLVPEQDGEPLNYFLNPYAEADGKPVETTKTWSFELVR